MRHYWASEEEEELKKIYADTPTKEIAIKMGLTVGQIYNKSFLLGLKKSKECIAEVARKNMENPKHGGRKFWIKKGTTPPNKGKKQTEYMSPEAIERTKATRFKKGQDPHNAIPDWQESSVNDEGIPYVMIKLPWRKKLQYKHIYLWEMKHGKVPEKHVVCFKDGNPENCVLENLECISMAENLHRNRFKKEKKWTQEQAKRAVQHQIRNIKKLNNGKKQII